MDQQQALSVAQKTFEIEASEILKLREQINPEQLWEVAKVLNECKNNGKCSVLCACGTSGMAAMKVTHALRVIEHSATCIPPSEALHGGSGFLREGDILFLFSKGGQSDELVEVLTIGKKKGAKVIAVTSKSDSKLAKESDLVLHVPITNECDRYNILPTSSIINVISIFDAICNILVEMEDYQLSQLGGIHPGGAVGKKLL